jgi:hypothetical protein
MVVMGRAAPFTRSNRASGVGVIVKMHTSYPARHADARRDRPSEGIEDLRVR